MSKYHNAFEEIVALRAERDAYQAALVKAQCERDRLAEEVESRKTSQEHLRRALMEVATQPTPEEYEEETGNIPDEEDLAIAYKKIVLRARQVFDEIADTAPTPKPEEK